MASSLKFPGNRTFLIYNFDSEITIYSFFDRFPCFGVACCKYQPDYFDWPERISLIVEAIFLASAVLGAVLSIRTLPLDSHQDFG